MTFSHRRLVVTIFVAALVVRVALLVALDAHRIDRPWDFGYETGAIAEALATGRGFSSPFQQPSGPTAWVMPAYPAILALIFAALGSYSTASAVAILLFNCLCSALTCWAVYRLAEEVFDPATALVTAAVMAIYPPSIWHAVNTIWDTSLLGLLIVSLTYGLYRLRAEPRPAAAGLWGLALGAAAWVNPIVLVAVPILWLSLCRKPSIARGVGAALLATAVAAVAISPWLLRNHRQLGRWYLRSNLGLELELGNSDAAWEDYQTGLHTSAFLLGHPSTDPEELRRFRQMGEAAYVDHALSQALGFIRENPSKFARLSLRRVYFFWLSDLGARNEWIGNLDLDLSLSWIRKACHLVPIPFLLLGIGVALARGRGIGPLLGWLILFPIVYYVTHVSERYRYPIEPLVVALASYGAIWTVRRLAVSRRRRATA